LFLFFLAVNGLQRHLTGKLRRLAKRHEIASFFTGGVVFGKVPTRLTHEPNGSPVNRLPPKRSKKKVVGHLGLFFPPLVLQA